jgi:hypothetical protein
VKVRVNETWTVGVMLGARLSSRPRPSLSLTTASTDALSADTDWNLKEIFQGSKWRLVDVTVALDALVVDVMASDVVYGVERVPSGAWKAVGEGVQLSQP